MRGRQATAADAGAITATIARAFHDDPVWSWAFPDEARRPAQFVTWWGLFVGAALEHGWSSVTDNCEAVALWFAPGEDELTAAEEARALELVDELIGGPHAREVKVMLAHFDGAHPKQVPHYYLSIVATDPEHRGHGFGVALLAEGLARIDGEHMPAYLESSNPANHARYRRLGFEPIGEFPTGPGGPPVLSMWRPALAT